MGTFQIATPFFPQATQASEEVMKLQMLLSHIESPFVVSGDCLEHSFKIGHRIVLLSNVFCADVITFLKCAS